jgi:uncharacterized protein DUF4388
MSLKGTLQDMSLVDLIRVFEATGKSGVLLLHHATQRGVIFSRDGRLIDAAVVDGPTRQVRAIGEDAVIALLQWDDATFVFRPDAAVEQRRVRIFHANDWLVLEGMRRRPDPLAALPHQPLTPDTRLTVLSLPSNAASSTLLNLNQWRVLSEASYCRDMRGLCESLRMAFPDVARTVAELVAIGLIEAIPIRPARQQPAAPRLLPPRAAPISLDSFDVIPRSAMTTTPRPTRTQLDAVMSRIDDL